MTTTPSLETCAALYEAAQNQLNAALRAVERAVEGATKHGFTEADLMKATSKQNGICRASSSSGAAKNFTQ